MRRAPQLALCSLARAVMTPGRSPWPSGIWRHLRHTAASFGTPLVSKGSSTHRTPVEQYGYDKFAETIDRFFDPELLSRLLFEGAALSIDEAAEEALTL
jgi:hypothetical protein